MKMRVKDRGERYRRVSKEGQEKKSRKQNRRCETVRNMTAEKQTHPHSPHLQLNHPPLACTPLTPPSPEVQHVQRRSPRDRLSLRIHKLPIGPSFPLPSRPRQRHILLKLRCRPHPLLLLLLFPRRMRPQHPLPTLVPLMRVLGSGRAGCAQDSSRARRVDV